MTESSRREAVRLSGRILFLTEEERALCDQLEGKDLCFDPERKLIDCLSTDEITPSWVCYYYDAELSRYCLVGLRHNLIRENAVRAGGFEVLVAGRSLGCGSSRETAPFAMLTAGIRVIGARSLEKIFQQNAENIGLLMTTDFDLLQRLAAGEAVAVEEFTRGRDPISADIVRCGGLFAYNRERLANRIAPPCLPPRQRAMTLCEKILAAHSVVDVTGVAPGDALFARCDVRFSHEYVTPMAVALLQGALDNGCLADPDSVYLFRDHLTLLDQVIPEEHLKRGLGEQARTLAQVQEAFAARHGLRLHGEVDRDGKSAGSEAICHNMVIESIALPGQLVIGTDSHSCMAGALGCFAFGVGATDMAAAWLTKDVRVTVPETLRVDLKGRLPAGVAAKDVMLYLLTLPPFCTGGAIGKVIEFGGAGLATLPLDERATLANMSVEAGGFTGIMEPDEQVIEAISCMREIRAEAVRALVVRADPGARYAQRIEIDLGAIESMVACPGDPRNGVPLRGLGPVRIDIAYGGSCTGGKKADMDMYAEVLREAIAKGRRVASGVSLYIQFGSQSIRRYAEQKDYVSLFLEAGANLLDPSCGACIRAGPGVSTSAQQITVSAVNRNYPGRSGPGQVYLASPFVVAASAIAGRIAGPEEI